MIKIIVAYDQGYGIGLAGKIPWQCPKDLEHFYQEIDGKILVVGLNTFLNLNLNLFKRNKLIILSKEQTFSNQINIIIYHDLDKILNDYQDQELYIIGGSETYQSFLPYAESLIITKIKGKYDSDSFFPKWDIDKYFLKFRKILDDCCEVFYYQLR